MYISPCYFCIYTYISVCVDIPCLIYVYVDILCLFLTRGALWEDALLISSKEIRSFFFFFLITLGPRVE